MGANVLVEFKMFFNWGHFFQMGAMCQWNLNKNYFGIKKISYIGNYMDP